MICYACSNQAVATCPRCGRAYCADHGSDICAYCAEPAAGTPSRLWYRGSVLALAVTSLVGIWLLAVPPDLRGSESSNAGPTGPIGVPATVVATRAPATGTPGFIRYTVQSGDTLASIADQFNVSVDRIRQANSLTSDVIRVGQELTIPR